MMDFAQVGDCASEGQAFLSCAANRPASDYECDAAGESDLVDGVCAAQSNAFLTCVLGGAGGAGMGAADCPFTNDGECDEPDICPAGTDTADCS
jgi:hypothetical protein